MKNIILIFILLFIFSCSESERKTEFMNQCTGFNQINDGDNLNFENYCECSYKEIIKLENNYNDSNLELVKEAVEEACKGILLNDN